MDIRLVIFDFDGTLADTRHNIVITMQEVMRVLGMPMADEETCAATIGLPLNGCFKQIYPHLTDEEAQHCTDTYKKVFFANEDNLVPDLFPHVRETIEQLHKKGIKIAIASSRTSVTLFNFVRKIGLSEMISMVVGSDEVTRHKPDPEPAEIILYKLGIAAENAIVVGDMPVDIAMGRGAGTHTCGVTFGNATAQELKDSGAEFLIADMAQLTTDVIKIDHKA